jgi:hypothetical protein
MMSKQLLIRVGISFALIVVLAVVAIIVGGGLTS